MLLYQGFIRYSSTINYLPFSPHSFSNISAENAVATIQKIKNEEVLL